MVVDRCVSDTLLFLIFAWRLLFLNRRAYFRYWACAAAAAAAFCAFCVALLGIASCWIIFSDLRFYVIAAFCFLLLSSAVDGMYVGWLVMCLSIWVFEDRKKKKSDSFSCCFPRWCCWGDLWRLKNFGTEMSFDWLNFIGSFSYMYFFVQTVRVDWLQWPELGLTWIYFSWLQPDTYAFPRMTWGSPGVNGPPTPHSHTYMIIPVANTMQHAGDTLLVHSRW